MRIATFVTAAALALSATVGLAQSIAYDFDRSMDFDRLRTYSWVPGTELSDDLNHRRIVDAVDAQLRSKGLRKVEKFAHPDVLVAYHASFDRDLQIEGFSSGWGGYRFAGTRSGTARVEEILRGTLAIDMVDALSNTIVWRAMAGKDIDVNAKPEKREKNINKTVAKLFKSYPAASERR
jgi:Domain of unknown function (DUF4136)